MDTTTLLGATKDKMRKTLEVVRHDLGTIRTGRATPALVENVVVNAYDGTAKMKLSEMATITASDSRTLVVSPFDTTQTKAIEKSILESNIGLTPMVDGNIIRLTVPSLTEERREEFIKLAKAKIEGGRVMVRQIRHDVMAQLKRAKDAEEVNEDERTFTEKKIQDLTDELMAEIDSLWSKKEEELRQI